MMSFETARSSVEEQMEYVDNHSEYSWLIVEFFGGEPLLNFPVIRELLSWARDNQHRCPVMFMVVTNGTLLTEEVRRWVSENKDLVCVSVSYDGSEVAQRTNRGSSIESALEYCHREWPDMSFRMTVSPDSLPTLSEDIRSAAERGYMLRSQLAFGMKWSESDRVLFEKQLRELKDYYISHPDVLPALLPARFTGGEDSPAECVQRCGAGRDRICYDVDGTTYACSMFAPVCAGAKALPYEEYHPDDTNNHNDPFCIDCPIRHSCYVCPAQNIIERGHPALRDHGVCRMNLTQSLVAIEFQAELLARAGLTSDSASLLKALLRIHRKIKERLA